VTDRHTHILTQNCSYGKYNTKNRTIRI